MNSSCLPQLYALSKQLAEGFTVSTTSFKYEGQSPLEWKKKLD